MTRLTTAALACALAATLSAPAAACVVPADPYNMLKFVVSHRAEPLARARTEIRPISYIRATVRSVEKLQGEAALIDVVIKETLAGTPVEATRLAWTPERFAAAQTFIVGEDYLLGIVRYTADDLAKAAGHRPVQREHLALWAEHPSIFTGLSSCGSTVAVVKASDADAPANRREPGWSFLGHLLREGILK